MHFPLLRTDSSRWITSSCRKGSRRVAVFSHFLSFSPSPSRPTSAALRGQLETQLRPLSATGSKPTRSALNCGGRPRPRPWLPSPGRRQPTVNLPLWRLTGSRWHDGEKSGDILVPAREGPRPQSFCAHIKQPSSIQASNMTTARFSQKQQKNDNASSMTTSQARAMAETLPQGPATTTHDTQGGGFLHAGNLARSTRIMLEEVPRFAPAPVCLCKYARSQIGVRDRPSLQGMSAHWCWTASRR